MGRKYFEESELWYLVLTLLSAGYFFHGKGRKVGDVRPGNVFISEDGSVKVGCCLSWPM
jgi:DNA-binding helix-hairpin-helix protein with protein kinase domain